MSELANRPLIKNFSLVENLVPEKETNRLTVFIHADRSSYLQFDDYSYEHTRLGKQKFKRKAPHHVTRYENFRKKMSKRTWGELLNSATLRDDFEEINFKSIHPDLPELFPIPEDMTIDKVGIFKYYRKDALRFGGLLGAEGKFYIFWIDQKKCDIYDH